MFEFTLKSPGGDLWGILRKGECVQITLYKRTVPGRKVLARLTVSLQQVQDFYLFRHSFYVWYSNSALTVLAKSWGENEFRFFEAVL